MEDLNDSYVPGCCVKFTFVWKLYLYGIVSSRWCCWMCVVHLLSLQMTRNQSFMIWTTDSTTLINSRKNINNDVTHNYPSQYPSQYYLHNNYYSLIIITHTIVHIRSILTLNIRNTRRRVTADETKSRKLVYIMRSKVHWLLINNIYLNI